MKKIRCHISIIDFKITNRDMTPYFCSLARDGTIDGQVQAQESLVDATRATYRLSTARYDQGIDIYLNVLDAQRSMYAAELELIATRFLKYNNQVNLYAALGGGGV
jgi:multidrug efflux system outer membrane protein